MRTKAIAFAPGHISALFAPSYHKNIFRTGSLGAGVCITSGCTAKVEIELADKAESVMFIEGRPASLEVSTEAVHYLLGAEKIKARVKCDLKPMLPVSQGFGMSAAGTLSVLIALCKILGKPHSMALQAAHRAEVVCKTGLGDVAGISAGGYEIRVKPGIPPYGYVDRIIPAKGENVLILCVLGDALETKKVLSDKKMVERCAKTGEKIMAKLLAKPTVKNLFDCGFEFSLQTGLATPEIQECVKALRRACVPASMVMLGNSVFALTKGNKKRVAEEILQSYGKVFCTKVWHAL